MNRYLLADVGFSFLKDQGQVLNVVGLKEAINLRLAGARGAEKTHQTGVPDIYYIDAKEIPDWT